MPALVLTILVFVATGVGFVLANLALGKLIRPNRPTAAKSEVYECGELPIGSSGIQFDLRFYVVALLFVVFDVEIAFFFPWALVFGQATRDAQAGSEEAHQLAEFAFFEFAIFFGILLVGFAYLWKRGDLEWVRAMVSPKREPEPSSPE